MEGRRESAKERTMKMTGEELYQYTRGLKGMMEVVIDAYHRKIPFGHVVEHLCRFNDEVLLVWKDKGEDADQCETFNWTDFLPPRVEETDYGTEKHEDV
jgi:hypothetical protein